MISSEKTTETKGFESGAIYNPMSPYYPCVTHRSGEVVPVEGPGLPPG